MARFRWVLAALSAFLPHAVTPYNLGAFCNPEVSILIDEAVHVAARASMVLGEVLTEIINNRPTNECHWAVENILSALVGTNAAASPQAMGIIQNRLSQLAQRTGHLGMNRPNIMFHCREVQDEHQYTDSDGYTEKIFAHPVKLSRIRGALQPHANHLFFKLIGGEPFYLVETTRRRRTPLAYTFNMLRDTSGMDEQLDNTGSSTVWSDVTMLDGLWPIRHLADVNWAPNWLEDQELSLLNFGRYPFSTIIHELMHSIALPDPIIGHAKLDGEDVDSILDILELASQNSPAALNNPQTYAYLALALSMPWLKWWANTDGDDNGAPNMGAIDQLFRADWNTQPRDGNWVTCIPSSYRAPRGLGQDAMMLQLGRGFRAFES
ncbi:MAG: hypothetical protein M1840_004707 [Geoglossum simile]|nr:MAG: hypothetical protein M1840_004707 [Geoglossum simile]